MQDRVIGMAHRSSETLEVPAGLTGDGCEGVSERVGVNVEPNTLLESVH